ncbi:MULTISPECIES: MerR family transcriptional regulator [Aliagarivorans]|uniref:MerR family transcriptional regulator n=1 Tax=Aliagarivorans TaxID=882379 RepID=UPI0004023F94|nr:MULTISPECIES: MerR family DNA-binding transcriptional regulator [Aliagarivorans]
MALNHSPAEFTIGQLAKEFEVSTRSIRFYEDEGLLSPQRSGNQRLYNKHDKLRLKLVLRGKRLGFSLAEIKELFDLYDAKLTTNYEIKALLHIITNKRQSLLQQLEDIQVVLMELKSAERRCYLAQQKIGEGNHAPAARSKEP